jgi:hypothetical protein
LKSLITDHSTKSNAFSVTTATMSSRDSDDDDDHVGEPSASSEPVESSFGQPFDAFRFSPFSC